MLRNICVFVAKHVVKCWNCHINVSKIFPELQKAILSYNHIGATVKNFDHIRKITLQTATKHRCTLSKRLYRHWNAPNNRYIDIVIDSFATLTLARIKFVIFPSRIDTTIAWNRYHIWSYIPIIANEKGIKAEKEPWNEYAKAL